ncbi:ComF family protein [Escherichia coli]
MKVNIKPITGNWDLGYAMDKHLIKSTYLGDNEYGKPMFQNDRTEVGEAVYQLKYQNDMDQVDALAQCLLVNAVPLFQNIQLIIPMAASNVRKIQPVTAITDALASKIGNNMFSFNELLIKAPGGVSLKNLNTKEEKEVAVADAFSYQNQIVGMAPLMPSSLMISSIQEHPWKLQLQRYAVIIKSIKFM